MGSFPDLKRLAHELNAENPRLEHNLNRLRRGVRAHRSEIHRLHEMLNSGLSRSDLKFGRQLGRGGFGQVNAIEASGRKDLIVKAMAGFDEPPLPTDDDATEVDDGAVQLALLASNQASPERRFSDEQMDEVWTGVCLAGHPNVGQTVALWTESRDGERFIKGIVMENYGITVADFFKEFPSARANVSVFAHVCRQALRGLQHIHRLGYVHSDIKFGNLMIDRHLNVRIVDFGATRRSGQPKAAWTIEANSALIDGVNLTPRVDLYALGETISHYRRGLKAPHIGHARELATHLKEMGSKAVNDRGIATEAALNHSFLSPAAAPQWEPAEGEETAKWTSLFSV